MVGLDSQLGGSIPQQNDAGRAQGIRPLLHSPRAIALILDKTLLPGYGYLDVGQLMAEEVTSGKLVPVASGDSDEFTVSRSMALRGTIIDTAIMFIAAADSYKYAVGQNLILRHGTTYHDGGAIVSIVIDELIKLATVTFTTAVTTANFTTVNNLNCYLEAGVNARFSNAKYILDSAVDTGVGEYAVGALAPVVISNAIVYTAVLQGNDAQSITDLGLVTDGRFTILK